MWRSMLIDFFSLLLPNNKIPTSWNRWLIRCYKLNWDWSATFSHNFRRLCDVNKSLVKATLTGRELGVEMRWKILKLIHLAMDVFFRRGEKIFKSDYDWFFFFIFWRSLSCNKKLIYFMQFLSFFFEEVYGLICTKTFFCQFLHKSHEYLRPSKTNQDHFRSML